MNSSNHQPYDPQALFDAKVQRMDYTFTFGTDNPRDLNLDSEAYLLQGYWMNLAALRSIPRNLSATSTPQVETLYHASKLVDLLWIEWNTSINQITGTWRADA